MRTRVIDAAGFEAKFKHTIDPWDYTHSPFEAHKRRVLLHAVGSQSFGRGLELACAIGETTKILAPKCLRLLALDSSITALSEAKRRMCTVPNVTFEKSFLPSEMPRGPFDLIVASEILYYLKAHDLRDLLARIERATSLGGRVVILHHINIFEDAAQLPRLAQQTAYKFLDRRMRLVFQHQSARFQAVAFRRKV